MTQQGMPRAFLAPWMLSSCDLGRYPLVPRCASVRAVFLEVVLPIVNAKCAPSRQAAAVVESHFCEKDLFETRSVSYCSGCTET